MSLLQKSLVLGVAVAALTLGLSLPAGHQVAEARPQYVKAFKSQYESKFKGEFNCNICHEGKDKKNRNTYGKAFDAALGAKNCKDEKKLAEALEKCAAQKSAVEGKTFGELIEEGKPPASKE